MLQTKFEIGTSKITLAFHYLKLGLQKNTGLLLGRNRKFENNR